MASKIRAANQQHYTLLFNGEYVDSCWAFNEDDACDWFADQYDLTEDGYEIDGSL